MLDTLTMERNDSLLISVSYFWSNTLNAFIFGHGPMTITLVDIYMLTDLRITGSIQPYDFLSAGSKKVAKISDYTGWASYILNHIGDGSTVDDREHVAFLNMWLEKFIFCGSSYCPNYNHKYLAERLATGNGIPLENICLSSDAPSSCLIAEKLTSVYHQWPFLDNLLASLIASPDGTVGKPPTGSERSYIGRQCLGPSAHHPST